LELLGGTMRDTIGDQYSFLLGTVLSDEFFVAQIPRRASRRECSAIRQGQSLMRDRILEMSLAVLKSLARRTARHHYKPAGGRFVMVGATGIEPVTPPV
jgi:hypothetical protein